MMSTIRKIFFIITCLYLLPWQHVSAQDRPEHEIHAMMMYNFIKYIEWPQVSDVFIIGVIGDDKVYQTLNTWYGGKKRGDKTFLIKKFDSAQGMDKCNIIFIGSSNTSDFNYIIERMDHYGVLIITNKPGMAHRGSGINFKMDRGRMSFELNRSAIEASRLKVSKDLMSLATIVDK